MMGIDIMLDGFLGLFGTYVKYEDIVRHFGMFEGFEGLAVVIGHTINSSILSLVFVNPKVYSMLPGTSGLKKGLVFGVIWHVCVILFAFLTSQGGATFMRSLIYSSYSFHVSLFLLHVIWGAVLGYLYIPEKLC